MAVLRAQQSFLLEYERGTNKQSRADSKQNANTITCTDMRWEDIRKRKDTYIRYWGGWDVLEEADELGLGVDILNEL